MKSRSICEVVECHSFGSYCRRIGHVSIEQKEPYVIPKVSAKQKDKLKDYKKVNAKFLRDNPLCMFPDCGQPATEVHHAEGRIGDKLTDVSTFRSLCHKHHLIIEISPKLAKELNLSASRLKSKK